MLTALDNWMARHPWHPRITPMIVYVVLLLPVQLLTDGPAWTLWLYPVLYAVQCGVVAWMLWRSRRLTPELNVRFHWLAVPVGVGVVVAWVALGRWMVELAPGWFGPGDDQHYFVRMREQSAGLYWASLSLRLAGMAVLVPLFEELFVRSLLLRSFHRPRKVALGVLQIVADMPVVGEWFEGTRLGQRVIHRGPVFGPEFQSVPLGALSLCGVAVSTFLFTLNHIPRDWPACVVCGIAYCLLVGATNQWGRGKGEGVRGQESGDRDRESGASQAVPSPAAPPAPMVPAEPRTPNPDPRSLGLGPVVWAHAITNALLWYYCIAWNDWQFM